MAQLKRVNRPFGEVNVTPPDRTKKRRVRVTVPLGVQREGSQTGVALDASGSMSANYADPMGTGSVIRPVAQNLCMFLAGQVDADGGTTAVYWALGTSGEKVEFIGDLTEAQAKTHPFESPRNLGGGTQLLPVCRYFEERFRDAPWGIYAILTDGQFSDLAEVKRWSRDLAKGIKAGTRKPLKLVLIGVGDGVDEKQMEQLDDLADGTDLPDLWDHKIAADMRGVSDIFAEVVTANARVAKTGKVIAPDGTLLKDYSDVGVPGVVEFDAPAGLAFVAVAGRDEAPPNLHHGPGHARQILPGPRDLARCRAAARARPVDTEVLERVPGPAPGAVLGRGAEPLLILLEGQPETLRGGLHDAQFSTRGHAAPVL